MQEKNNSFVKERKRFVGKHKVPQGNTIIFVRKCNTFVRERNSFARERKCFCERV